MVARVLRLPTVQRRCINKIMNAPTISTFDEFNKIMSKMWSDASIGRNKWRQRKAIMELPSGMMASLFVVSANPFDGIEVATTEGNRTLTGSPLRVWEQLQNL